MAIQDDGLGVDMHELHAMREARVTMMLADAAAATDDGPLAGFSMSDDDRYELRIAGWLHDCGKVTTP